VCTVELPSGFALTGANQGKDSPFRATAHLPVSSHHQIRPLVWTIRAGCAAWIRWRFAK
jgi:hypothetical protein